MDIYDTLKTLKAEGARLLVARDANVTVVKKIDGQWTRINPYPRLRLPTKCRHDSTLYHAVRHFGMLWFYDTAGKAPHHWTGRLDSLVFGPDSFDALPEHDRSEAKRLTYEQEIVWTQDVSKFDYVRETIRTEGTRQRQPRAYLNEPGFTQVGYGVLRKDAPGVHPWYFERRVFWLKDYDRGMPADSPGYADGGSPCEAVNPSTIVPGLPGKLKP